MSTPLVHPSPSPLPSSEQVLSPLQLTKLPPLQFSQENADYFDAAKLELKYSMQHLLQEVINLFDTIIREIQPYNEAIIKANRCMV